MGKGEPKVVVAKRNAVVTFKDCPKCRGTGKVPCDGKERFRQKYMAWAMAFHMKPVVYTHRGYSTPGLAVATVQPGGWWCLDIYVGKTRRWSSGRWDDERDIYLRSRRLRKKNSNEYANFEVIFCRARDAKRVKLLEFLPEHLLGMPTFELGELDFSKLLTESVER